MSSRDDTIRIGLMVPSSNTVMEVDLYRRLPGRFQVHTSRMYLETTTPEGEGEMLDKHAIRAARDIGTARPDVVVFGCTSAGALRGHEYDEELCGRIAEASRSQTMSTIAAVRDAVRRSGARRIGVITPYVDALNEKIRASLEVDGVEVDAIHGLGISDNFEIAMVEPAAIVEFAVSCFVGRDIELLFASCTNFRAVDAIGEMRRAIGVPVTTSNQAVLDAILHRFGQSWPVSGEPAGEPATRAAATEAGP